MHKRRFDMTSLVHNNIYVETGAARRDVTDQSLVENYAIAGQEDVTRTLRGSQRCHRTRVRERSESTILDAVHGLCKTITIIKLSNPFLKHPFHVPAPYDRDRSDVHLNTAAKPVSRVADVQACHPSDDHVFLATALTSGVHLPATRVTVIVVQTRS